MPFPITRFYTLHSHFRLPAISRSLSPRVRQQTGYSRIHVQPRDPRCACWPVRSPKVYRSHVLGSRPPVDPVASMADPTVQCDDRTEAGRGARLGRGRSRQPTVLLFDRGSDRQLEIRRRSAAHPSGRFTMICREIAGFMGNVTVRKLCSANTKS